MKRALLVFVKAPVPGQVKTRLRPALTPEEAADIYACFLEDGLRQYTRLTTRADVRICFSPAGGEAYFRQLMAGMPSPVAVTYHEQVGADLGERMRHAFEAAFDSGYEQAVVIGSDHPTLPDEYVVTAFDKLQSHEVVIGPTEDGGYYLLGSSRLVEGCFANISWSTSIVYTQTMQRLSGQRVAVLPTWYDVDDPQALRRCRAEIFDGRGIASRTEAFLRRLEQRPEFAAPGES